MTSWQQSGTVNRDGMGTASHLGCHAVRLPIRIVFHICSISCADETINFSMLIYIHNVHLCHFQGGDDTLYEEIGVFNAKRGFPGHCRQSHCSSKG